MDLRAAQIGHYPRDMTNEPIKKPLSLDDYQARAAETAQYPASGTGSITALAYVGLGLGEAGEIQGKIKKIMRDEPGMTLSDGIRIALAKEAGDLLWYVARLGSEIDMTLEQIAQMNLNKLADRKARGVIGGSGDDR